MSIGISKITDLLRYPLSITTTGATNNTKILSNTALKIKFYDKFTWNRLLVRFSITGLLRDIIIELVFITSPSFSFSTRFPCTGELMCSIPKFAGFIVDSLKLKTLLIFYTQNRNTHTLVHRSRVLHVLCVRGFYEVSNLIMYHHLIVNVSKIFMLLRQDTELTLNWL